MSRKIILLAVTAALALTTAQVLAKMYRWTDDQGNVVYSQTPPPDDRPVKSIAPPPPPTDNPGEIQKETLKLQEQLDNLARERKEKKQQQRQAKEEKKAKAKNCSLARQNLKAIEEKPPNTLWGLPDGSYKRFTMEERQKKIDAMNKIIKENCQ